MGLRPWNTYPRLVSGWFEMIDGPDLVLVVDYHCSPSTRWSASIRRKGIDEAVMVSRRESRDVAVADVERLAGAAWKELEDDVSRSRPEAY